MSYSFLLFNLGKALKVILWISKKPLFTKKQGLSIKNIINKNDSYSIGLSFGVVSLSSFFSTVLSDSSGEVDSVFSSSLSFS